MPTTHQKASYSRLRSRGEYAPGTVIQDKAVASSTGGESWLRYGGTCSPTGEVEVMSDVVVPGFNRRVAKGEILFNPMSQVRTSVSGASTGPLVTRLVNPYSGQTYEALGNYLLFILGGNASGSTTPTLGPVKALTQSECDRAILEACTQARRPPSEASLLVTLAEMDKTRRLVPDLLHNWSELFRKLNQVPMASRRLTTNQVAVKDAAHKLKAFERSLTETWLAMRFGVRPLIMDTLGLIKAANRAYAAEPVRVTQRGHAHVSASSTGDIVATLGVVRHTITYSSHDEFDVRAMMLWEAKMTQLRNSGVSLANIPEAVVDLVRFSFVLNWVVNVNDFFASLGAVADPGLADRGGCFVQSRTTSSTWQAVSSESTDPTTWALTRPMTGVVTATVAEKHRVVGLKSAGLVVRAAPLRFLGDARLVDAIALLRQQTRGRNVRYLSALSSSRTGLF